MGHYLTIGLIAVWIASLGGVGTWQHSAGRAEQKAEDQVEFDRINAEITAQKAEADGLYRLAQDANLKLVTERDKLKTNLEKSREENRTATNARRDEYSTVGLRYGNVKGAGLGVRGGSATSPGADPARPDAPAVLQLPDALAANLRQLVYDADTVLDEYRKAYGYAQQVR